MTFIQLGLVGLLAMASLGHAQNGEYSNDQLIPAEANILRRSLQDVHPLGRRQTQPGNCADIGRITCVMPGKCIRPGDACCSDGSGCRPGYSCVLGSNGEIGCCEIGKICAGPGGSIGSSTTLTDYFTSTSYNTETYSSELPGYTSSSTITDTYDFSSTVTYSSSADYASSTTITDTETSIPSYTLDTNGTVPSATGISPPLFTGAAPAANRVPQAAAIVAAAVGIAGLIPL